MKEVVIAKAEKQIKYYEFSYVFCPGQRIYHIEIENITYFYDIILRNDFYQVRPFQKL